MVGDASSLMWATSVPLGVARLTADFVHSDPISKSDRRALRDHIVEVLAPVVAEVETFEPKLAVGSSGTLESLAEMVAARRDEDTPATLNQLTITRQEFLELHKDLLASKATERLRIEGLDAAPGRPHRRRLDGAGDRDGAVRARPAHDQRMGAARGHRARRGRPPRSRRLVRRPARHPRQRGGRSGATLQLGRGRTPVRSRSCRSTSSTRPVSLHGLDDADRELLEFAALLHDVGEHVASSGHHKHGAYLVRNGQLRGFAPDQIEMLAAIVRWHRRGEPRVSDEFPLLDAAGRRSRARRWRRSCGWPTGSTAVATRTSTASTR